MQTDAALSSRTIRQARPAAVRRKFAKPGILARIRRFIEFTDWDERYLCHRSIDGVCLGIIALSLLYFVPFMLPVFLK